MSLLPPTPVLRATADAARLAQVVSNLLHNAAKFTARGRAHPGRGSNATATKPRIVVRDNGIGIRADMLPRIFDLFTQADSTLERSQGGLGHRAGAGRTLVEMHGGTRRGAQRRCRDAAASSS